VLIELLAIDFSMQSKLFTILQHAIVFSLHKARFKLSVVQNSCSDLWPVFH